MVVISLLFRRVRSIHRGLTLGSRMGMRTSRLEPSRASNWHRRDGMSDLPRGILGHDFLISVALLRH